MVDIDLSALAADPSAPDLFSTQLSRASIQPDDGDDDRISSLVYTPPKSLEAFFVSDTFASFAVGPVGSLKTTAGVMKIAYEAKQIAPCRDGVRRTRYAWIRNCYDEETEILTPDGWVGFAELSETSPVATLVDGALVWEVPKLHYLARHSGKMIGLRAQGFDLLVTPDHELWMSKAKGRAREWQPYERTRAYEAYGKGQMYRMSTTAAYAGGGSVHSEAECEFLGFWMAEGCAGVYDTDGRKHYRLNVAQNPRTDRYVERLLERCGYRYSVSVKNNGVGRLYALATATAEEKARVVEFAGYGKAATKRLPTWAKKVDRARARAFIHGYQQGDGTFSDAYAGAIARLRTISPVLADDLQHMAVLAGYSATISWRVDKSAPGKAPMAAVTLHHESRHEPIVRKTDWYTVEDYDGMVHCVEVSSGVVLVRRNGKAVWCGQTREMLRDTSIPDFLQWYPDGVAGSYLKSEMRYTLRFDDVECEILFRGLDDADDVRRLLSMQLTGAIMDEFREINPSVYKGLASRLGRYPNKRMNARGCRTEDNRPAKRIWGMSNPPDYGTFWEELLNNPPDNVHVTIQPSGVSPEADWVEFLDQGYYENLLELHKNDQDWIDVYVHAKFGASLSGKPVFRTFSKERHVAKDKLNVVPATLIIAVDPGVACTAAVLGQATFDGRVLVHDAIYSLSTGAARFIDEKLKPLLAAKYASCNAIVVMDPAGRQRAASDENTAARVFKNKGFRVKFASTNSLSARVASVETFLNRTVNDNPALVVAPHNVDLIHALAGKYRYKVKKNGDTEDEPEKLHPISDLADCVQYLCMEADGGETLGRRVQRSAAPARMIASAGWT